MQVKKRAYHSLKIIDNYGNVFMNYHEASRYWDLAPNTIRNDVIGKTNFDNTKRKVRFMKGE